VFYQLLYLAKAYQGVIVNTLFNSPQNPSAAIPHYWITANQECCTLAFINIYYFFTYNTLNHLPLQRAV